MMVSGRHYIRTRDISTQKKFKTIMKLLNLFVYISAINAQMPGQQGQGLPNGPQNGGLPNGPQQPGMPGQQQPGQQPGMPGQQQPGQQGRPGQQGQQPGQNQQTDPNIQRTGSQGTGSTRSPNQVTNNSANAPSSNAIASPSPSSSLVRPLNVPICDFYTQALLNENSEANQKKFISLFVGTIFAGNFTATANNLPVSGVLVPSVFMGEAVDLRPFFTGANPTTNANGQASSVNFLDGGDINLLTQGKASNDPNSKQERMFNHMYQIFATMAGCSRQGGQAIPAYAGNPSMAEVHKFMGLNIAKISFFNDQVSQAARAIGMTAADAKVFKDGLENTFNIQCAPPVKIAPNGPPAPQGFCLDVGCQVSNAPQCPAGIPSPAAQKMGISTVARTSSAVSYTFHAGLFALLYFVL